MAISKVRGYTYQPWAVCITTGCKREWPASSATRDLAKQHAKTAGHHVQIVQENHDHWAPADYDFGAMDKSDEELAAMDPRNQVGSV